MEKTLQVLTHTTNYELIANGECYIYPNIKELVLGIIYHVEDSNRDTIEVTKLKKTIETHYSKEFTELRKTYKELQGKLKTARKELEEIKKQTKGKRTRKTK